MSEKRHDRRGLGRGLSALMADVKLDDASSFSDTTAAPDLLIPVERLLPNPDQPRRSFSEDALEELAESIREKGVIQPLIVRPSTSRQDQYEIVAGERRWRAAQLAQLHEIPAIIRDLTDTEMLEVAIIENIQRADLNPVEEAAGYRSLMDRFGHTQERLASALGKSRSHIANLLRLLSLPDEITEMLRDGRLSSGHARALITADDPATLARKVVAQGLSVRETEKLSKGKGKTGPKPRSRASTTKDADTRVLEQDLSAHLHMSVVIDHDTDAGGGAVTIRYKTLDDLDRLCQLLSTTR